MRTTSLALLLCALGACGTWHGPHPSDLNPGGEGDATTSAPANDASVASDAGASLTDGASSASSDASLGTSDGGGFITSPGDAGSGTSDAGLGSDGFDAGSLAMAATAPTSEASTTGTTGVRGPASKIVIDPGAPGTARDGATSNSRVAPAGFVPRPRAASAVAN